MWFFYSEGSGNEVIAPQYKNCDSCPITLCVGATAYVIADSSRPYPNPVISNPQATNSSLAQL